MVVLKNTNGLPINSDKGQLKVKINETDYSAYTIMFKSHRGFSLWMDVPGDFPITREHGLREHLVESFQVHVPAGEKISVSIVTNDGFEHGEHYDRFSFISGSPVFTLYNGETEYQVDVDRVSHLTMI